MALLEGITWVFFWGRLFLKEKVEREENRQKYDTCIVHYQVFHPESSAIYELNL
jgi:hypothetical protein